MNENGTRPGPRGRGRVGAVSARSAYHSYAVTAMVLGLLLTAAVLLVGCGGSEGNAAAAAGGSGDSATTVEMVDNSFVPQTLTVAAGETVTWVNVDPVSHNAVADDESWGTDIFGEGGSAEITFDTPGTHPYNCTLHAGMVGTVVVE